MLLTGGIARRARWLVLLVAVVVTVGMTTTLGGAPADGAAPELALVRSTAGVVAVDTAERAVARTFGGVASPDGRAVVAADVDDDRTRLTARDPATGDPLWERELEGELGVELVGFDGEHVVLVPHGPDGAGSTYAPTPRSSTTLVISRPDGTSRRHELVGNYQPEAFSRDGATLFVISYVPPTAPERYQVRRLDLTTGEVGAVYTPHDELQEEMGGSARTQAWSADGRRLYTLYTAGEGADRRGFVHVVDLQHGWAHCIDLPADMPLGEEYATGIALSAEGSRLIVADGASGRIAEIDTVALEVRHTRTLDEPTLTADGGPVAVAIGADGDVVIGQGRHVVVLSGGGSTPRISATMPGVVAGFHLTDPAELHVVLVDRRIVVLDGRSGEQADLYRLPGSSTIEQVGSGSRQVDPFRQDAVCAC